jgi:hypothetical protein
MHMKNDNSGNGIGCGQIQYRRGVAIRVDPEELADYLETRKAQLRALVRITNGEAFALYNQEIQSDVRSLLTDLVDEVTALIPVAIEEARTQSLTASFSADGRFCNAPKH